MDLLLEILKLTLPSLTVFLVVYYVLKAYIENDYKIMLKERRSATKEIVLPLRLQAYERMTLFLERLAPNNLLIRVRKPGMSAREFHGALLSDIRAEFDHNLAQQIYISPDTWDRIKHAKEDMNKIINISAEKLNDQATAKDLSKIIFETLIQNNEIPTQNALDFLKKEIQKYY